MKRAGLALIVLTTAMVFCAGAFGGKAEASQRYGYRYRPGYRTYYNRPSYRPYRYSYRPYYRTYYRPHYRPYYSFGFGAWPYLGAYWGPTYYYPPYYSVPAYYGGGQVGYSYQSGSVRTQAQPKATEVYVDGYYAGIVDDFDGTFQRLYLPPGRHQIELRLEGYRSYRQTLLVNSGTTYKIHHEMVPLDPGETNPPPIQPRQPERTVESYEEPQRQEPPPQERDYRSEEPAPPPRVERPPTEIYGPSTTSTTVAFGMLSLRIKPADAEIVIDGEQWGSLEGMEQMIIHLPAGRHQVEIRKEGYRSFTTEVEIERGVETPLNVRLAL